MDDALAISISALFKEVGAAHHQAFIASDGADPEWPLWYAEHLHQPLQDKFHMNFTKSDLIYLLVMADKEHSHSVEQPWPEYYAKVMIRELAK